MAGPCCSHHCPPPPGHSTSTGMEVTQQPTVPQSCFLGHRCDVCLFPVSGTCCSHQDFAKRGWPDPSAPPALCMPGWVKCSLMQVQKLFPGSWQQGNVDCSCSSAESAAPAPPPGPEGSLSMAAVRAQLLLMPPAAGEVLLGVLCSGQCWESHFQSVLPSSRPPPCLPCSPGLP